MKVQLSCLKSAMSKLVGKYVMVCHNISSKTTVLSFSLVLELLICLICSSQWYDEWIHFVGAPAPIIADGQIQADLGAKLDEKT